MLSGCCPQAPPSSDCRRALRITNTDERYIPGDFYKQYDVHDKIAALGGVFVKDRDGLPDGWYIGAGAADAEANYLKMPGVSTPKKKQKKRARPATPVARRGGLRRRAGATKEAEEGKGQ